MSYALSSARFTSVLTVTAVLFFLCLLPFELIPEIPVDIDSKPFFVPLALCALLPARATGLAIGLGVALGEGLRDLMEGYELDDPIGFFGYIAGFWAASWIFAFAPRSRTVLVLGAITCAAIQSSIEATSFLLFGSEGLVIAVESAAGNTLTHGVIWGAVPLLFLVPALRGRFEPYLGFDPLGADRPALPPPAAATPPFEAASIAAARDVSFRHPGAPAPSLIGVTLDLQPGEIVGLVGARGSGKSSLALVMAGLAPAATGGDFQGAVSAPESVAVISGFPGDQFTQSRPVHHVAAALLADGGEPEDALARARLALSEAGLPDERHEAYVWTLTKREQALVHAATAIAASPALIVVDEADEVLGDSFDEALDRLIASCRVNAALVLIDSDPARLKRACDRIVHMDAGRIVAVHGDPANLTDSQLSIARRDQGVETGGPMTRSDELVEIPTLQKDAGGWWRKRDPRVKWALFFAMILLIYIAPDWRWMAAMTALGALTMLTARPPAGWMAFALLVQAPNVLGLILLPLIGGEASTLEELGFGFRLGLGWIAAILFGVSLLSTMDIPEISAGLRGLGLPRRFAFVVGYAFVLIYLSMADFAKSAQFERVRETFSLRRPFSAVSLLASLFVPIVSTVARRGGTMAIALQSTRAGNGVPPFQLGRLALTDWTLAVAAALLVAEAAVSVSGLI